VSSSLGQATTAYPAGRAARAMPRPRRPGRDRSREVSQYHTQIRREVDRLTAMIDDLFELSKIHAGALRLSRRMVGLEDLVAEVVASAEPVARAKGVRLTGAAVRGMPVFVDGRRDGPGAAQPGDQRDQAHAV